MRLGGVEGQEEGGEGGLEEGKEERVESRREERVESRKEEMLRGAGDGLNAKPSLQKHRCEELDKWMRGRGGDARVEEVL